MKYLIGIDAGTTNVKAVLFDENGYEKLVALRENVPIQPENAAMEMDMEILWRKTLECLQEIVNDKSINKQDIIGISIAGQGEGLWLVDKNGVPVANSRLWNDGRATDIIEELQDKGLFDYIHKITGTQMFTGSTLVHILYAKKHSPQLLEKADKLMFCKDWIRYKLTGKINIEYSDAATSLLDIKKLSFSKDLFDKLGILEYERLLPEALHATDIAGTLHPDIASKIGLSPNIPIGTGAIDVVAASIGVGAINNGDTNTILGTTCATSIVTNSIEPGVGTTRFEVHGRDGYYINLQPTMSGTPNIDWMLKNVAQAKSFEEIDIILNKLGPVAGGIIYHPYIAKSGERAPFYNPNARASYFGLSSEITNEYLIKAVYEGIAFSIKDCLESINTSKEGIIYLAGGGAKSSAWAQIISDVTGHKVEISEGKEFASKGAAVMLGLTLGIYKDFEDLKLKTCRSNASYTPNLEHNKVYEEYYQLYREMREGFNKFWNRRREIRDRIRKGKI